MRASLKYALIFAGISIAAKIVMFSLGYLEENATTSAMVYLFLLLVSIFISLSETKSKEQTGPTTYFMDLKSAIQNVAYFTILITLFTYIYYQFIDTDFMINKISERMSMAAEMELSPDNNPRGYTKEEFIENEQEISEIIFSPYTHSTITLMAFTLVGIIYSTVITWLVRKNTSR